MESENDITEHYEAIIKKLMERIVSMEKDALMFRCLQETGVDNWIGYDEAMKLFQELEEESNNGK